MKNIIADEYGDTVEVTPRDGLFDGVYLTVEAPLSDQKICLALSSIEVKALRKLLKKLSVES